VDRHGRPVAPAHFTNIGPSWNEQLSWGGHEPELYLTDTPERSLFPHWRTQSANAGPAPLLHETVSASPSFETETVPPVQVIEASVSPEPQVRVQLLPQASCLTT
jgi:hypothetical protein